MRLLAIVSVLILGCGPKPLQKHRGCGRGGSNPSAMSDDAIFLVDLGEQHPRIRAALADLDLRQAFESIRAITD